jgi:hypothetical protein
MSKTLDDPLNMLREFVSKGILIDANLLVVYTVGIVDPRLVGKTKRTENFNPEDAKFLIRAVQKFKRRFTTPGILTETTNLLEPFFKTLREETRHWLKTAIREDLSLIEERWIPGKQIAEDDNLLKFGFGDLAITALAGEEIVVLTADLPLHLLLQSRGLPNVNYNHLRMLI